jgi:hypothetical protein
MFNSAILYLTHTNKKIECVALFEITINDIANVVGPSVTTSRPMTSLSSVAALV